MDKDSPEQVTIDTVIVPGLRIRLDGNRSVFLGTVDSADVPAGEGAAFDGISYPNILELVGPTGRHIRLQLSNEAIQAIVSLSKGQGEISEAKFSFGKQPEIVWVTVPDESEDGVMAS